MLEYAMQYYGTTAKVSDEVQLKIDQMIENVSICIELQEKIFYRK